MPRRRRSDSSDDDDDDDTRAESKSSASRRPSGQAKRAAKPPSTTGELRARLGAPAEPCHAVVKTAAGGDPAKLERLFKFDDSLDGGEFLDQEDARQRSALHHAAARGHHGCVETLLTVHVHELQAENAQFVRTLKERQRETRGGGTSDAVLRDWFDTETLRLQRDVIVDCERRQRELLRRADDVGCTPLHYAASAGSHSHETLRALLQTGRGSFSRELFPRGAHFCPMCGDLVAAARDEEGVAVAPVCGKCSADTVTTRDVQRLRAETVNARDARRCTALHYAAACGHIQSVKLLLRHGADKHAENAAGETPLNVAKDRLVRRALMDLDEATGADDDVVSDSLRLLLQAGTDVNQRTGTELRTALHGAAAAGKPTVVQFLLDNGATVDVSDANGWTPLHCAASGGLDSHQQAAEALIAAGANVSAVTSKRCQPLHLAAQQPWLPAEGGAGGGSSSFGKASTGASGVTRAPEGVGAEHLGMLQLLVQHGAQLDAGDDKGDTPLHHAARRGRVRAAFCLVCLGADVYAQNRLGWNCLHTACLESQLLVARMLAKYDCERRRLKQAQNVGGKTPYDVAKDQATRLELLTLYEAAEQGDMDEVRRQVRLSAAVSRPFPWTPAKLDEKSQMLGRTPLHASTIGMGKLAREFRIKINHARQQRAEQRRLTAQRDAAIERHLLVMRFLLDNEAFVDPIDRNCATPLMYAARDGVVAVIATLLDRGADVRAEDRAGNSALHMAYAFGHTEAATALEAAGADVDARNAAGKTPPEVAGMKEKLLARR